MLFKIPEWEATHQMFNRSEMFNFGKAQSRIFDDIVSLKMIIKRSIYKWIKKNVTCMLILEKCACKNIGR